MNEKENKPKVKKKLIIKTVNTSLIVPLLRENKEKIDKLFKLFNRDRKKMIMEKISKKEFYKLLLQLGYTMLNKQLKKYWKLKIITWHYTRLYVIIL